MLPVLRLIFRFISSKKHNTSHFNWQSSYPFMRWCKLFACTMGGISKFWGVSQPMGGVSNDGGVSQPMGGVSNDGGVSQNLGLSQTKWGGVSKSGPDGGCLKMINLYREIRENFDPNKFQNLPQPDGGGVSQNLGVSQTRWGVSKKTHTFYTSAFMFLVHGSWGHGVHTPKWTVLASCAGIPSVHDSMVGQIPVSSTVWLCPRACWDNTPGPRQCSENVHSRCIQLLPNIVIPYTHQ